MLREQYHTNVPREKEDREEEANVYVKVTSLPKCVYSSFSHSQTKTIALEGDFRPSALD